MKNNTLRKKEKIQKIVKLLQGLTIEEARNLLMDCQDEIYKQKLIS